MFYTLKFLLNVFHKLKLMMHVTFSEYTCQIAIMD